MTLCLINVIFFSTPFVEIFWFERTFIQFWTFYFWKINMIWRYFSVFLNRSNLVSFSRFYAYDMVIWRVFFLCFLSKPYKSSLAKDNLTRRDQGTLVCSAANMEGKSTCTIEVTVVSKPEMPQDRLLVSNITRSSCRLNWKAPKDDGGLPVEYIIEKYTANGDSWAVHVSTWPRTTWHTYKAVYKNTKIFDRDTLKWNRAILYSLFKRAFQLFDRDRYISLRSRSSQTVKSWPRIALVTQSSTLRSLKRLPKRRQIFVIPTLLV